jgi:uncharacterized repeat protein (TIGR03833 family)
MYQKSVVKRDDFDWYKYESNLIGVRERKSGGYAIKPKQIGTISSFKTLIEKIIKYYRFQYLTFDSHSVPIEYLNELKAMKFETFQTNNYVFQETPKVGDYVMIAIKPYTGKYEKGKIKAILTNIKYHPRGVKVVLNDKNSTIGRIATLEKKFI